MGVENMGVWRTWGTGNMGEVLAFWGYYIA